VRVQSWSPPNQSSRCGHHSSPDCLCAVVAHWDVAADSLGVATVNCLGAAIACRGATIDCLVAGVDHQDVVIDYLGAAADLQGAITDCLGAAVDHQGAITDYLGAAADRQGAIAGRQDIVIDCEGVDDLTALRPKRLLLRYVLIVEAIDTNVWIFTSAPRWAPTVEVYDNDLV
jgi:hypothetical protein